MKRTFAAMLMAIGMMFVGLPANAIGDTGNCVTWEEYWDVKPRRLENGQEGWRRQFVHEWFDVEPAYTEDPYPTTTDWVDRVDQWNPRQSCTGEATFSIQYKRFDDNLRVVTKCYTSNGNFACQS